MLQAKKEQYKILNRVNNFLEKLCSGNGQQKLFTTSTNTYKRNKIDVDINSDDNDTDSVYVNPGISRSKLFE